MNLLISKLKTLVYFISFFITILLFPLIFFSIKVVGIFYKIRLTELQSERYGHLTVCPQVHLIKKKESNGKFKYLDFFCESRFPLCNKVLMNLWKKKIMILPRSLIGPTIYLLNKIYSQSKNPYTIFNFNQSTRIVDATWDKYEPFINLSPEQHESCVKILSKNNIEIDKIKFVCLFNRDNAYLNSFKHKKNLYYRSHQNYNIKKFNLMADELSKKDIYTFRMGSKVEGTFGGQNAKIIDYANSNFRSELMDIFLAINCMFGIVCGTGSSGIAQLYKKPFLDLNGNIYQLHTADKNNILLSKHYFSEEKKRNLNLRELMQLDHLTNQLELNNTNIQIVDCKDEEIKDACLELLDRLQGNWKDTAEDINLQKIFRQQYDNFKVNPRTGLKWHDDTIRANYSNTFLRKNKNWLN